MEDGGKLNFKKALTDNFLNGAPEACTDEAILQLILSCALPNRDVRQISKAMIDNYGSIEKVLSLDHDTLCKINGIKGNTATLIKLFDWVRKKYPGKISGGEELRQQKLSDYKVDEEVKLAEKPQTRVVAPKVGSGLFINAIFKETVEVLPKLPITDSMDDLRSSIKANLHQSSQETRTRYQSYITRRMFAGGKPNNHLIAFSKKFTGKQELKDVCFYHYCKAEPLLCDISRDLLIPNIGQGRIDRAFIRDYLSTKSASKKMVNYSGKAIVAALSEAGIVKADLKKISYSYRGIPLPSLAYLIYSEFQAPGMYNLAKLEENAAIQALLWVPDKLLNSLYELRNRGLIGKISEIDTFRQFTLTDDFDTVMEKLLKEY